LKCTLPDQLKVNNKSNLDNDVKDAFTHCAAGQIGEQNNLGYGKIEKRTCRIITAMERICKSGDWLGLQTLIEIKS
jgi:hypothetical protein